MMVDGLSFPVVHDCGALSDLIQRIGFLPLLDSAVSGYSAMEIVDEDCRYSTDPIEGFVWPLWQWKGPIILEGNCVYGKFFDKKAGFVSMDWWPDLCNYRRSKYPAPEAGSIEETILSVLQYGGSMITRELRKACDFTGKGMRSKFDGYVTRLQMGCRIVTEDFVYPRDRHGKPYGWGWSLLTTPEALYGRDACRCHRSPEASYERLRDHFRQLLPTATDKQLRTLIG